jgi:hypothetical protein
MPVFQFAFMLLAIFDLAETSQPNGSRDRSIVAAIGNAMGEKQHRTGW